MSVPEPAPLSPGRYCLATCYCGECDHYEQFVLTATQRAQILHVLSHPSRKYTPAWYRDPLGTVAGRKRG